MKLFVDRFRYQASKAKQVQSRIKMLEKITPIEVPPERKKVRFTFPASAQEWPHGDRAARHGEGLRRHPSSSAG